MSLWEKYEKLVEKTRDKKRRKKNFESLFIQLGGA
jgi:hypothetical protein